MLLDVLVATGIGVAAICVAILVRETFMGSSRLAEENRKLRKRLKQLKEELRRREKELREHYEALLREASVRNSIMVALYNAWKEGKLRECYDQGGDVRILADGTLLCDLGSHEKSYALAVSTELNEGDEREDE